MAVPARAEPRRSPSRRALKAALAVIGLAIAAAIGIVLIRPTWIANALRHQVEEVATRSTGRPVTIGGISARWFPRPGATISNFAMQGDEGEPPIVDARSAAVTVKLWPLIRSLGKDVELSGVELNDATLNLVRRADGKWNYEEIQSSSSPNDRQYWLDHVKIRNGELHVTDKKAAGGTGTVALRDIDLDLANVGAGMPLSIKGDAALASNEKNVEVDLQVNPLPASAEEHPTVTGNFRIKSLHLTAFRNFLPAKATSLFTGGIVDLNANVSTDARKHYAVNGHADARAVQLRGQPANGGFNFATTIDPANPTQATVALNGIALKGPGIDLGGTASIHLQPVRADFALKGNELDLDQLLAVLPQTPKEEKTAENAPLIPDSLRSEISKMQIAGSLQLANVHSGKLAASDLNAQARLDDGVLTLSQGEATVYSGRVHLNGTRIDLTQPKPKWDLNANVQALDLGQAFAALSGHQAVTGKATGALKLSGAGNDWVDVRSHVTGDGSLEIADGELTSTDLGAAIAPALATGLQMLGQGKAAGTVGKAAQYTKLRDLRSGFAIRDGWMSFTRPIGFNSDFGGAELNGRIALDQRVDLHGKLTATPAFVKTISNNALTPKAAIPVPVDLAGTLLKPAVKPGNPTDLAKSVVQNVPLPKPVEQEKQKMENEAKQRAGRAAQDVLHRLGR